MGSALLCVLGVALFGLGVFLVGKANAKELLRYRQLLLPLLALVYGAVAVAHYAQEASFVQGLVAFAGRYIPLVDGLNVAFLLAALLNFVILLGFALLKLCYCGIASLAEHAFGSMLKGAFELCYAYDEGRYHWFLRTGFLGVRRLLRNLHICAIALAALLFVCYGLWPSSPAFQNPYYPALAVLVLGEARWFLSGMTRREYEDEVSFSSDEARRIFQYAKLREVLAHYFGDRIVCCVSRPAASRSRFTHDDFCEKLIRSEDFSERLAGGYFKALVDAGVLCADGTGRYDDLNHDTALDTVRMLQGRSVMFASPFYRDFAPYVFFPLFAQLIRNRHALFLYGPQSSEDDIRSYIEEGLAFAGGVPGLWDVGVLLPDGEDAPDVALLPFPSLGDTRFALNNETYLADVSFVVVIDPSSLLATYQIGLSMLAERLAAGIPVTYCIFDANADGLVDSLSHALRTNLVEVEATEYAEGAAVGLALEADGDALQHRLFPGVAHYLGVGTEVCLVALKCQVSQAAWAASTSVPLADMRWTDSQYYGELCHFADLATEQLQLDERLEFASDMWGLSKRSNCFLVAEDERRNMFETFRQFSTRGSRQVFVNVMCPNYLLRDYMAENDEVFSRDAKAVPAIAPDFAKSQRNVIFSIVMTMSQNGGFIDEDVLKSRLRYVGISAVNVKEALEGLLIDHVDIAKGYKGALPEEHVVMHEDTEYVPALRDIVVKRSFGLAASALYAECFSSLRNVPLVTEQPDGSILLLGARLYGHVHQSYLPGQFCVVGGKYYEVVSISEDTGVVLRRAADHFSRRRYYRQLRTYTLCTCEPGEGQGDVRTVGSVSVQRVLATFSVATAGYLDMADFGDLSGAKRVELVGVPERRYRNKYALRLELPGASEQITRTIAVLMSEALVTLFPKDWPYLAVLCPCAECLPEGLLYRLDYSDEEGVFDSAMSEAGVLYVVEDSLIDIGLLSAADRNIQRILELIWEFLDWHRSMLLPAPASEPDYELGELPEFTPPERNRGVLGRSIDALRGLFGKLFGGHFRKGGDDQEAAEGSDGDETGGKGADEGEAPDKPGSTEGGAAEDGVREGDAGATAEPGHAGIGVSNSEQNEEEDSSAHCAGDAATEALVEEPEFELELEGSENPEGEGGVSNGE